MVQSGSRDSAHGPLLDAAIEGLSQGSLSIAQVCQRAGVQPPSLYHHFGSKEGLIAAAVEAVGRGWLERIAASLPPEGDLDARLAAARRGWRSFIEAPDRPVTLLIGVGLTFARESPLIREGLQRVYDDAQRLVCEQIEAAVGPRHDVESIAETLMGLVQAAALGFELDGDRAALARRLESVGRTLVALLGTVPSSR
jgi:AcrR family transcriptional regulator